MNLNKNIERNDENPNKYKNLGDNEENRDNYTINNYGLRNNNVKNVPKFSIQDLSNFQQIP